MNLIIYYFNLNQGFNLNIFNFINLNQLYISNSINCQINNQKYFHFIYIEIFYSFIVNFLYFFSFDLIFFISNFLFQVHKVFENLLVLKVFLKRYLINLAFN
jgi:hypothetical protein